MNNPERVHGTYQPDMLEVPLTVSKLGRRVRIPLEHSHAGLQLSNADQHALLRAVLPVDRVAAVINAGSLIPVCLHEKAGAVNAPAVVCARADVRPA